VNDIVKSVSVAAELNILPVSLCLPAENEFSGHRAQGSGQRAQGEE